MGAVASLGNYPKEYNARVHGPYVPWRHYGKPDTPFSQVRLIDLPLWLARRDKSAEGLLRGASRLAHKWHYKYTMPVKGSGAYVWQVIIPLSLITLYASYERYEAVRQKKYH